MESVANSWAAADDGRRRCTEAVSAEVLLVAVRAGEVVTEEYTARARALAVLVVVATARPRAASVAAAVELLEIVPLVTKLIFIAATAERRAVTLW